MFRRGSDQTSIGSYFFIHFRTAQMLSMGDSYENDYLWVTTQDKETVTWEPWGQSITPQWLQIHQCETNRILCTAALITWPLESVSLWKQALIFFTLLITSNTWITMRLGTLQIHFTTAIAGIVLHFHHTISTFSLVYVFDLNYSYFDAPTASVLINKSYRQWVNTK